MEICSRVSFCINVGENSTGIGISLSNAFYPTILILNVNDNEVRISGHRESIGYAVDCPRGATVPAQQNV